MACCWGSVDGSVVMRCERKDEIVIRISRNPGMPSPAMWMRSGSPRLASHRNSLLNGMSVSGGVCGLLALAADASKVTTAFAN